MALECFFVVNQVCGARVGSSGCDTLEQECCYVCFMFIYFSISIVYSVKLWMDPIFEIDEQRLFVLKFPKIIINLKYLQNP